MVVFTLVFGNLGMVLLTMMALYNFVPDWRILTLPLFILIPFAASIGAGLWLAELNVEYRDLLFKWGSIACLIL